MHEKQTISNPNNKIGIKTLTDVQIKASFPSYEVLLNRIEKIRSVAQNVDRDMLSNDVVESLKYDNILSIIGGRGAGKTSVLFTIYNELKAESKNIVLPIIMPELIEEHESIVSCLLSAMRQNLDCIEEKIKCCNNSKKSEKCENICKKYKFFDRCTFNNKNELRNQLENLISAYYSKENKNFGSNYPENEELMAKSQYNSFNLINLFLGYWNSLREVYSSYLECSNHKGEEPLFFIMLDDTDLKPQIINELLFIIPKYLSHPNVVVIVSAAHKTLSNVVKNHMFKSMTGKHIDLVSLMNSEINYMRFVSNKDYNTLNLNEMRFGKEYHKICKLSEEILRKLFPVYNRFYLKKYSRYEDKDLFMMLTDDSAHCDTAIPISEKIGKLIKDFYEKILSIHTNKKEIITIKEKKEPSLDTINKKTGYFSLFVSISNTSIKTSYLSFLGKYPRDISAVYYSLEETISELQRNLEKLYDGEYGSLDKGIPIPFLEQICDILLKFISSVVNSNRNLVMFAHCADTLIKPQLLNWQLYVDYSKVLEVFQDSRYMKENKLNCDSFVEMFCLLNLIEQLIVLVMPQRKISHGDEEFYKLMKLCDIGVIKHSTDINDLLDQYFTYHAFGVVPAFDINKIAHQHNLIRALEKNDSINKNIENRISSKIHDSSWYQLIAEVFYYRFDPFARLSKYYEELFIFKKYRFVGQEYLSFWNDYTNTVHVRLKELAETKYLSTNRTKNQEGTEDLLSFISKLYQSIHNHIEETVLSFNNTDEIESIIDTISRLFVVRNDYSVIKEHIDTLISFIKYEKPVKRYELEILFDDLSKCVHSVKRGYLNLKIWYNQLERCIEENITLDKRRKENREFIDALSILKEASNHWNKYIDYYLNNIIDDIVKETGDLNPSFINNSLRTLRTYMQRLENVEWYNIMKKE